MYLCFVSWEEHFTERARYALVGTRQYVFQHDFPPALETATVDAQTDSVVTVLEVVLQMPQLSFPLAPFVEPIAENR
jgi:hypothetical protein